MKAVMASMCLITFHFAVNVPRGCGKQIVLQALGKGGLWKS